MSFMQLLRAGQVSIDAIDDFVDNWKSRARRYDSYGRKMEQRTLAEYLGMSKEEYNTWIAVPGSLVDMKYKETFSGINT